ncbi:MULTISPECIES: hypothetical protein [Halobacillus]|uniref:Uncharacterized protein n=1 Tax=Halobacillus alkaliphilus TaxID=396056 RepID=A0A1I2QEE0_9BACI|nr:MULTISPECIES: hypothetical protein [Halobacillus]ASF38599.1 hypothetical protein CEH05_05555 [Halobacillus halophilus]MCA1012206.1 hypothetical protein [Halobacillus halophilus]SFG26905.1 hypothetical protein SAMN05216353_13135 [Halobacillus alkaliphilus]
MSQSLLSSILFLISAAIWAVLAIFYDEFRWLNIGLFILFLVIGLSHRQRYLKERDYEED